MSVVMLWSWSGILLGSMIHVGNVEVYPLDWKSRRWKCYCCGCKVSTKAKFCNPCRHYLASEMLRTFGE